MCITCSIRTHRHTPFASSHVAYATLHYSVAAALCRTAARRARDSGRRRCIGASGLHTAVSAPGYVAVGLQGCQSEVAHRPCSVHQRGGATSLRPIAPIATHRGSLRPIAAHRGPSRLNAAHHKGSMYVVTVAWAECSRVAWAECSGTETWCQKDTVLVTPVPCSLVG